ncbi:MAG: hypothetical protein J7494_03920 [Sphingobium sp.]|nr:hypothetical protein [Sphingobium sp.]
MWRAASLRPLQQWGRCLLESKGTKRAKVAVARKIAILLHSLWLFVPFDQATGVDLPATASLSNPTGRLRAGLRLDILFRLRKTVTRRAKRSIQAKTSTGPSSKFVTG